MRVQIPPPAGRVIPIFKNPELQCSHRVERSADEMQELVSRGSNPAPGSGGGDQPLFIVQLFSRQSRDSLLHYPR